MALDYILQHTTSYLVDDGNDDGDNQQSDNNNMLRILCPLAGDDKFVHYAWSQGHDVTAIDIVPDALASMRSQFDGGKDVVGEDDWLVEVSDNNKVWKHKSGRATLYEGDILTKRPELAQSFDVIYDKDSFGALTLDMRDKFCQRLGEYVKDEGTLYIEVKFKENQEQRGNGPPFHVEKGDLMNPSNFGACFEYGSNLGSVYPLTIPGMKQTGHVLRRALRK